jgi:hypothetical protein
MSNLPAPFDPNLLPAIHQGYSMPYSQKIFLVELEVRGATRRLPGALQMCLRAVRGQTQLHLHDDSGAVLGNLDPDRAEILIRLLEAGKPLIAESVLDSERPRVRIHLQEL